MEGRKSERVTRWKERTKSGRLSVLRACTCVYVCVRGQRGHDDLQFSGWARATETTIRRNGTKRALEAAEAEECAG